MVSFDTILSLLKNLVKSNLSSVVLFFNGLSFCYPKNSLLNHRPCRLSPVFYSLSFVVLTPFRSQIHLEVIFMSDVRLGPKFFFVVVVLMPQNSAISS